MPYKFETKKLLIPRELDKRVKLSLEEKQLIKKLYGQISQRKLAKMFGVSRRLIQFIGNPEQHKQNLLRRKENGGSNIYYDKDKNTQTMKIHRQHKYKLFKEKKLLEGQNENRK